MEFEHGGEVNVGEDVDVVEEKRLVKPVRVFEKKPSGFFQAPSGIEQQIIFSGNFDAQTKVVL